MAQFTLDKNNTGLLLIDVQGKLAQLVHQSSQVLMRCEQLIQGCQVLGVPIVWVEQNPERLGPTVEPLASLLAGQPALAKMTFDACDTPDIKQAIEDHSVENWLVAGIETHICVYQTVSHLLRMNKQVQVVSDATSSRNPDHHRLALEKMTARGAEVTCVEMCLYEMVKDCKSEAFKPILKLIK